MSLQWQRILRTAVIASTINAMVAWVIVGVESILWEAVSEGAPSLSGGWGLQRVFSELGDLIGLGIIGLGVFILAVVIVANSLSQSWLTQRRLTHLALVVVISIPITIGVFAISSPIILDFFNILTFFNALWLGIGVLAVGLLVIAFGIWRGRSKQGPYVIQRRENQLVLVIVAVVAGIVVLLRGYLNDLIFAELIKPTPSSPTSLPLSAEEFANQATGVPFSPSTPQVEVTGPDLESSLPVGDPVRGRQLWTREAALATGRPLPCPACHSLEADVVIVGPSLAGIGTRAAQRVVGLDAATYIRHSIQAPNEYLVPGENYYVSEEGKLRTLMPTGLADYMSAQDLADLISYLLTLK